MAKKSIDYSKWKKIDVSDDEDETLKHVDKESLFRWRHQSRLEKMAESKRLRDALKRKRDDVQQQLLDLQKRMDEANDTEALMERENLRAEIAALQKKDEEYEESQKELEKKDKLTPWNVNTIGRTGFNKTRINVSSSRTPNPETLLPPGDPKAKLETFYRSNKFLIRKFGILNTLDESEQFLLNHSHLCCDDAATLMASECMNLEMQDKREMTAKMARQTTLMNYLLQLATTLQCPPSHPKLISSLLAKMKKAELDGKNEGFKIDVQEFTNLVIEQLKEKKADLKRRKAEEKKKSEAVENARIQRLGPGGLDPLEVLESLPEEMRRCFEQKDLAGLERLAMATPEKKFMEHFQRCIDSGLWVPNSGGSNPPNVDEVKGQNQGTKVLGQSQATNADKSSTESDAKTATDFDEDTKEKWL